MNQDNKQLAAALRPERMSDDRDFDTRVGDSVVRCAAEMRNPTAAVHVLSCVTEIREIPVLQRLFGGALGAAGLSPETGEMRLSIADPNDTGTARHEFAHLVHLAHGYDVTNTARKEVHKEEGFYVYGDATLRDLHLAYNGNEPTAGARHDLDVHRLVNRVNEAFDRIHMASIRKDEQRVERLTFGRTYAAANAAETLAVLHEKLSGEDRDEALEALESARLHVGLLEAYFAVFNPTPLVARELTDAEFAATR